MRTPPPASPAGAPYAGGPAPGYSAPGLGGMSPALAAQAMQMPSLRKRPSRGFLRFFAVSCITTAWLSVVLCVILGLFSFGAGTTLKTWFGAIQSMAGASSSPTLGVPNVDDPFSTTPGANPGTTGLPDPRAAQLALMEPMLDRLVWLCWLGGFINILIGICTWLFFIGLGKLTYSFLDLEEQAARDHDAVQILMASAGR